MENVRLSGAKQSFDQTMERPIACFEHERIDPHGGVPLVIGDRRDSARCQSKKDLTKTQKGVLCRSGDFRSVKW